MSVAKVDPIHQKLPPMEVVWKDSSNMFSSTIRNILLSEIRTNCVENIRDSISGRIEVELRQVDRFENMGLPMLSGFTIFSLNLVGMPFTTNKVEANVCLSLYDNNNTLIKSYNYSKRSKGPLAFYYGKTQRVHENIVGRLIASDFKEDLNRDAQTLCGYLNDKVYYPMGTEAGKHILLAQDFFEDGKYKNALAELELAKQCGDINAYNEEVLNDLYAKAYSRRQAQLQQRAQTWAAVGAGLAVAGAATATTIATSKNSSSTVVSPGLSNAGNSSNEAITRGLSRQSKNSDGNNDEEKDEDIRDVKVKCHECGGSGKCRASGTVEARTTRCGGSGKCPMCNGSGRTHNKCPKCKGDGCSKCDDTGYTECTGCEGSGECDHCGGSGKCPKCGGSKYE